jgi:hypothetical protein
MESKRKVDFFVMIDAMGPTKEKRSVDNGLF